MPANRTTPGSAAARDAGTRTHRPRHEADPYATIPSDILREAVRRVAAECRREYGDQVDAREVAALLVTLASAVCQQQRDGSPPSEVHAGSALGRRLLELLRADLIRNWSEDSGASSGMPPLLGAIESVRVVIEPNWAEYFASHLSGPDGLELLVQVAHDLRSPLTSVLFLAETLLRGLSGEVNELQRRQLRLVYGAALGMSQLADDVIDLAKGGKHLVEKQPVPFSVTAIFMAVRDILHPIAEEKRLSLRFLVPSVDHRLGHPLAVTRVLLNLTTNALKFTDEGVVEIAAREVGERAVEFAVSDNGKGIDAGVLKTLYQPFRPARGENSHTFSRARLGLASSRKLVNALGSELNVETRRGRGTRFFFTVDLPLVAAGR